MDSISAILLGALNTPLFLFFCRLFRRVFFKDRQDFWKSLLAWSFDPHAFFDKDSRHNHLAVLFLSVSVACCVFLAFFEYNVACRFIDAIKAHQSMQAALKF